MRGTFTQTYRVKVSFMRLDDLFQGVSGRRPGVSVSGLAGVVVVLDRCGQGEDALQDADPGAGGG
ncbi:MAG TPA: hypothetical protein VGS60_04530, partial [Actinomycetes bacterium]|nr:hypothetical protein [Actinomycetes bacterium]